MGISCKPIIPKRYISVDQARKSIDKHLLMVKEEALNQLQTYPAWQPWKRPPLTGLRAGGRRYERGLLSIAFGDPTTTGLRAGGRRTGTLGRGWGSYTLKSGKSVKMTNNTSYGKYVQGNSKNEQARALARRGWVGVDVVAREAVKRAISRSKFGEIR